MVSKRNSGGFGRGSHGRRNLSKLAGFACDLVAGIRGGVAKLPRLGSQQPAMRTAKGIPPFSVSQMRGVANCPIFGCWGCTFSKHQSHSLFEGDCIKFALWLRPETLAKIEKLYRDDDCRSRSEFIEKAVLFYAGYLTADDGQEYFPNVIVSTVKGSLDSLENRMASLLFKMAVELSMTLHVTAATNQIDADTLSRLRGLCVEEVKRLHGAVRMEDAVKFQNGM